jgi:hypothetical protein
LLLAVPETRIGPFCTHKASFTGSPVSDWSPNCRTSTV